MIQTRNKIVLYSPHHVNAGIGQVVTKHYLPLPLMHAAGFLVQEGYDVVLVDGNLYSIEEGHRRALEACEGALLFATTGILGYQVADGAHCTQKVRARFPDLPTVVGGWFASMSPELYLGVEQDGRRLFDAVAIGQGELTFRDLVHALEAGEPLDSVQGLALWREGEVRRTPPRPIVGWADLPACPWDLLDFDQYRVQQFGEYGRRVAGALAPPPGYEGGKPYVGISYLSSYGCPQACDFCCSPSTYANRWMVMPVERMLDDLEQLYERWDFQVAAFYDADFGVNEKRLREFAEGLIARKIRLAYYPFFSAQSVLRLSSETLDLLAESGLYAAVLGAETGSNETMRRLGKHTTCDGNLEMVRRFSKRDISTRASYIIGFPGEDEESMLATLRQSLQMAVEFPNTAPTVWYYQPMPGTVLYAEALELGFVPPATLDEWGTFLHFKLGRPWSDHIPPHIARLRKLYEHFVTLANGTARGKVGLWERHASRRLRDRRDFDRGWPLGSLEAKAFDLYDRLERRLPSWISSRGTGVERGWKSSRGNLAPKLDGHD